MTADSDRELLIRIDERVRNLTGKVDGLWIEMDKRLTQQDTAINKLPGWRTAAAAAVTLLTAIGGIVKMIWPHHGP